MELYSDVLSILTGQNVYDLQIHLGVPLIVSDPFSCLCRYEKIVLKKWYTVFKDNVTLYDYEINDGCSLELYYA